MTQKNFKYIFGPVYSWRLGMSLGIDPLSSSSKSCNFNCSYCQVGITKNKTNSRAIYSETCDILSEVKDAPIENIDYYTFSGNGEPTLALNLGEMIRGVRSLRENKIAVITNSSLINLKDVRDALMPADFVLAKVDACDQSTFEIVNDPFDGLSFKEIIDGLKIFRRAFKGKLAVQTMFIEKNIVFVEQISNIIRDIGPDEVQINTPLRKSNEPFIDEKRLVDAKKYFNGMSVKCVYDIEKKNVEPINEGDTAKRHGVY